MNKDLLFITVGEFSESLFVEGFQLYFNQIGYNSDKTQFHFGSSSIEFLKENAEVFNNKACIYFSLDSVEILNFILFHVSPLSEIYINKKIRLTKLDFDFYNTVHYKNLKISTF
jgi:hypothetical protein